MRNSLVPLLAIFLIFAANPLHADESKGTCRITVQTKFVNGKTKVDVDEVPAVDRNDCKRQADERKINPDPSNIASINSRFGFSNPE